MLTAKTGSFDAHSSRELARSRARCRLTSGSIAHTAHCSTLGERIRVWIPRECGVDMAAVSGTRRYAARLGSGTVAKMGRYGYGGSLVSAQHAVARCVVWYTCWTSSISIGIVCAWKIDNPRLSYTHTRCRGYLRVSAGRGMLIVVLSAPSIFRSGPRQRSFAISSTCFRAPT